MMGINDVLVRPPITDDEFRALDYSRYLPALYKGSGVAQLWQRTERTSWFGKPTIDYVTVWEVGGVYPTDLGKVRLTGINVVDVRTLRPNAPVLGKNSLAAFWASWASSNTRDVCDIHKLWSGEHLMFVTYDHTHTTYLIRPDSLNDLETARALLNRTPDHYWQMLTFTSEVHNE